MTDFVHDILETPDLHLFFKMNPSYINAAMSIEGSSVIPLHPIILPDHTLTLLHIAMQY